MVNAVGLGSSVGSLHEPSVCQTKQSLVYDLQEPFRWIADVAVMEAFESGVLDLPDFYFTGNDYRYRFEPEAKERFLDLLREWFNSGARYKGRVFKWDTVIEQKTAELGRCLIGGTGRLDLSEPSPGLSRIDNREVRKRILSLTQQEARRLGIGKSTLHYLQRNAKAVKPLRIYGKVAARIRHTEPRNTDATW
jgi:CRISPR-associated protein Cas1